MELLKQHRNAMGGVYQIGTAEELAWFAKKTQGSTTHGISGKLTADIDLNGQNWAGYEMGGTIPSLAGYSGTFDGDGHTIVDSIIRIRQPSKRAEPPVWDCLDM